MAGAILATLAYSQGFASVSLGCDTNDLGPTLVVITTDHVQVTSPHFSTAHGPQTLSYAEATQPALSAVLPYGSYAVARAISQVSAVAGWSALKPLLLISFASYLPITARVLHAVLGIFFCSATGVPPPYRRLLSSMEAVGVAAAWPASAIASAIMASCANNPQCFLDGEWSWMDYETVLEPVKTADCTISSETSWLQFYMVIPMTVAGVLGLILSCCRSAHDAAQTETEIVACCAPSCCKAVNADKPGCCGDTYDDCSRSGVSDLCTYEDRATTNSKMDPALAYWMRMCALSPLVGVHIAALVFGIMATQAPVLDIEGQILLQNTSTSATQFSPTVDYTMLNGVVCVSMTDAGTLAFGYASQDCSGTNTSRRLALLNPINATPPALPDLSNVVLPEVAGVSRSVASLMTAQSACASLVLLVLVLFACCNVREGRAFRCFRWWGTSASLVLLAAGIASSVASSNALEALQTMQTLPYLSILGYPQQDNTVAGQQLANLMTPFGPPLQGFAVYTSAWSPALGLVQAARGLAITSAVLAGLLSLCVMRGVRNGKAGVDAAAASVAREPLLARASGATAGRAAPRAAAATGTFAERLAASRAEAARARAEAARQRAQAQELADAEAGRRRQAEVEAAAAALVAKREANARAAAEARAKAAAEDAATPGFSLGADVGPAAPPAPSAPAAYPSYAADAHLQVPGEAAAPSAPAMPASDWNHSL